MLETSMFEKLTSTEFRKALKLDVTTVGPLKLRPEVEKAFEELDTKPRSTHKLEISKTSERAITVAKKLIDNVNRELGKAVEQVEEHWDEGLAELVHAALLATIQKGVRRVVNNKLAPKREWRTKPRNNTETKEAVHIAKHYLGYMSKLFSELANKIKDHYTSNPSFAKLVWAAFAASLRHGDGNVAPISEWEIKPEDVQMPADKAAEFHKVAKALLATKDENSARKVLAMAKRNGVPVDKIALSRYAIDLNVVRCCSATWTVRESQATKGGLDVEVKDANGKVAYLHLQDNNDVNELEAFVETLWQHI